jgi:hypothetical protein
MFGRHDDPREIPDFRSLDRVALARALTLLAHLDQFHTLDVVTHHVVSAAHRERVRDPEFFVLVEKWLTENAVLHGLRGPLPGHPARGERWAWQRLEPRGP